MQPTRFLRRLSAAMAIAGAIGCAGPETRAPEVAPQVVAREQVFQRELANKTEVQRAWLLRADQITKAIDARLKSANADLCRASCGPVQMVVSPDLNAFADGEAVAITAGLVEFAGQNDHGSELALVLGHEHAHNILRHLDKRSENAGAGIVVGLILSGLSGVNVTEAARQVGAEAYSQSFETEADVLGAYMAARAGFDVAGAANLWRRLAATNPSAIHAESGSHPNTAQRFVVLERVAAEIARKKAAGLPLVPEKR